MNRALGLSTALHAIAFALVLFGPAPKARSWDLAAPLPVTLVAQLPEVPTPREEAPEPVREQPEVPVKERMEAPEPEPEPVPEKIEPTPPEPSKPTPRKRPPRKIQRFAPRRDEAQPTLAERLKQRLATPADEAATPPPEDVPAPPDRPAPAPSKDTEVLASDFPFAWYLNTLRTKITDAWDTPAGRMVGDHDNRVVVRFRIHRDGRVSDVQVDGSSGAAGLEASVRRAVEGARPFPVLPEAYVGDFLDVAVRFTLSGAAR